MDPLIVLRNCDVMLGSTPALRSISLQICAGQAWLVRGGNGAGKSTLLRLLRGEIWPHFANHGERLYHFDGRPDPSPIPARPRITLVSAEQQDLYRRHDWNMSAADAIRTGFFDRIWLQEDTTPEQNARVADLISLLAIEHLGDRSMTTLSTGETRRVLLARALASNPRVLLLDEFCNGLDAQSRATASDVISTLIKGGTSVVMTSHHEEEILPGITHVAELHEGKLLSAGRRADPPPTAPTIEITDTPTAIGEIIIRIVNADVFIDEQPILQNLSWEMREGEHWAVLGPNGSGKSTFLRFLYGDEQPAWGGIIERFGLPEGTSVWEVKSRFGYVAPELQSRYEYNITSEEVVLSGFHSSIGLYEESTPQQREQAADALARTNAESLRRRPFRELSYGQARRILLARAIVHRPKVLLLDEPCTGLDAPSRTAILNLLEQLAQTGTHLIMTSHHPAEFVPSINRVLRIA